jgi:site-specific recombinase XerD
MVGLRHFFAHLENAGLLLLNPALSVPLPRREQRLPRRILKPSDARKLLDAPDAATPTGLRDRAILELFYSSGIRLAEMGRLTLPDVDLQNGFVRIIRGKGGKDRVVPIGESACQAVARYLAQGRQVWLKTRRQPGPTDALWLSAIQPHQPIAATAIPQLIRHYALDTLGRGASPHVWRHTCATHLLSNGANIVYVQRLLGHKSLTTTQIYTRVGITDLKRTLARAHPRARLRRPALPAPA